MLICTNMRVYADLLTDQMYCREQYDANLCGPATRLPAVKDLCRGWEQCMMRPFSIGKTKVMAEIIGDAANGFSEILSLRTMVTHLNHCCCMRLVIHVFFFFFSRYIASVLCLASCGLLLISSKHIHLLKAAHYDHNHPIILLLLINLDILHLNPLKPTL